VEETLTEKAELTLETCSAHDKNVMIQTPWLKHNVSQVFINVATFSIRLILKVECIKMLDLSMNDFFKKKK